MNRFPRHLTELYPTFNPKKICYNHRDPRYGAYVYNLRDNKHQRFYCLECIDKYALLPRVVSTADHARATRLQKLAEAMQVAPLRPAPAPGIPTPYGDPCDAPAPAMRVLEGTP